ncbi:hypothetical protein [Kordiimonas sp. SCSIO 12610]|uniref:hypothetical protein n=1 Tax=Kordiimonas sp. SCSIO 12610 TaxID=2829597 RepID=UPI00210A8B26|nr:hypothetical protein [Kordiimonas sp. SCSIO 12610]UTW56271.1 hypothetical protein KFF44_05050 [Kordiimonas sp. SCSIO 12610]
MQDIAKYTEAARLEIEGLHTFFDDWFGGLVDKSDQVFDERFSARFDTDCILIQPGGVALGYDQFKNGVKGGHGSSPGFKVQIRNVEVRPLGNTPNADNIILVTYEEWQKNAINSSPPNNGRAASVIFKIVQNDPVTLKWYHIHETWLPKSVMDVDDFDF